MQLTPEQVKGRIKNVAKENKADAKRIVDDIKDIDLGDGVTFEVKEVSNIMDEMEYPGIRFTMNAVDGKICDTYED